MKVAIASSGLGHIYRGMEAWAEDLAQALFEKGVDVTLFRGAGPLRNEYDVILSTLTPQHPLNRGALTADIGPINIGFVCCLDSLPLGVLQN
ncbi:hypothetical protein KA005_18235 [bacterium]|nr:hypothetical protein [bacterium]